MFPCVRVNAIAPVPFFVGHSQSVKPRLYYATTGHFLISVLEKTVLCEDPCDEGLGWRFAQAGRTRNKHTKQNGQKSFPCPLAINA